MLDDKDEWSLEMNRNYKIMGLITHGLGPDGAVYGFTIVLLDALAYQAAFERP